MLPVIILILAVIGSIYTGIATATESAALGVFYSLIIGGDGSIISTSFFFLAISIFPIAYCSASPESEITPISFLPSKIGI